MSRAPFKVAIVGISGYGRIHLQLAREAVEQGLMNLVAAVVINRAEVSEEAEMLERNGTRLHATFEEMVSREAGRIDLCLIPTGIAWHARMTIAALRAGMNVLVEKPLASSLAEVDAIAAESVRSGRFVAVGFQDIYNPLVQQAKERLLDGAIGRLQSVRFLGLWPRPTSYFTRNGWAGRMAVDGVPVLDSPLNNAFAHFVNLALFFAGDAFDESAKVEDIRAGLWRTNAIEMFDTGVVTARTADGVALWFGASHACMQTHEPEIHLQGDRGGMIWRHENECIWELDGGSNERVVLPSAAEARRLMMLAVMDCLAGGSTFLCVPRMARRHTELITRVHELTPIQSLPGVALPMAANGNAATVLAVTGLEAAMFDAFANRSIPQLLRVN
ncbi:MAG: Gfo/Idh/MocA family oxidoreductase [Opitutaceae bacterium]|nr:Gfo/Idh/MocA family oxidoreductase [Opitutaceae bacterium]